MSDHDHEENEEYQHTHRWSLLKDQDFYEQGDLISRYFLLSAAFFECPHTDSPLVDTVESVAFSYLSETPFSGPGHRMVRAVILELTQTIANHAFVAGMRFALDGHRLDGGDKFMSGELSEQPEEHAWNDERAEETRKWRELQRKANYIPKVQQEIPDDLRAALEKLTGQKIPDGMQIMNAPDGGFAFGVPVMRGSAENDENSDNPTGYL